MVCLYSRTSVTVDEAIANLLDLHDGPVVFQLPDTDHSEDAEKELEKLRYDLNEELQEEYEWRDSKLAEAKCDQAPTAQIVELKAQKEAAERKIKLANDCRCAIDDELLKREPALLIDPRLSSKGEIHITLESLRNWADSNGTIARVRLQLGFGDTSAPDKNAGPDRTKAWWQPAKGDPIPAQPWYTPARYFARELVTAEPYSLNKRDALAKRIVSELYKVQIYKRGGLAKFDPGTVKKALSNVNY